MANENNNEINMEMIQNLISQLNFDSEASGQNTETDNHNHADPHHNDFNLDINTILKMKDVMNKLNSNQNDPRSNLLLSLKPYLNRHRKEKLDQYMQFLRISQIIEAFQANGELKIK